MKKIDWARKLTSRKFWIAVASFVGMLVSAFGMAESEVTQVTSLILAGATVIAYIIGEGLTDAASINTESTTALDTIKYPDGTEVKVKSTESVYEESN